MIKLVCLDVHKVVADLEHHRQPAVFSTLFDEPPVEVCKQFCDSSWGIRRTVVEDEVGDSALNLFHSLAGVLLVEISD